MTSCQGRIGHLSSLDVSRSGLRVDDILELLPRLPALRFLAIQALLSDAYGKLRMYCRECTSAKSPTFDVFDDLFRAVRRASGALLRVQLSVHSSHQKTEGTADQPAKLLIAGPFQLLDLRSCPGHGVGRDGSAFPCPLLRSHRRELSAQFLSGFPVFPLWAANSSLLLSRSFFTSFGATAELAA